jgi:hypothetical protein
MISKENLDKLKLELSVQAKNGIDFILSAAIVWLVIAYLWTLNFEAYDKSILVFIVGSLMLPLAFLFSKLFKTNWTIKTNPLQPLGLWLNFAQLFYFPFLIFTLLKMPEYFVMVYAIITGAHFFPYAWFYKTNYYAIFAGIISVGSLILGLVLPESQYFILPVYVSASLLVLFVLLYADSRRKLTHIS